MAASTAELRQLLSSDKGEARTKALASLVGVMIVAAVAALILVAFNHSNTSHTAAGAQPSASDVGHQSTPSASVTSAAPAAVPAAVKPTTVTPAPAKAATNATTKPATKTSASATTAPAKNSGTSTSAKKPVTYVVKHGDNLTVIAAWFHQHGYHDLYQLNRANIGANPNLIFPGEKITISNGAMTLH